MSKTSSSAKSRLVKKINSHLASRSSPMVFGGLGKLRMTSLASWDLLTMASLRRTAVCMRRMLFVDSLILKTFNTVSFKFLSALIRNRDTPLRGVPRSLPPGWGIEKIAPDNMLRLGWVRPLRYPGDKLSGMSCQGASCVIFSNPFYNTNHVFQLSLAGRTHSVRRCIGFSSSSSSESF